MLIRKCYQPKPETDKGYLALGYSRYQEKNLIQCNNCLLRSIYLFHFVDDMQALGMESGAIADSQITASSQFTVYHGPKRARLHTEEFFSRKEIGAWSSLTKDLNQWLQVDLCKITPVTHVATQGRNSYSPAQMVTKYKLQFSNDGASFLFYKRQGESSDAVNRNIIYTLQDIFKRYYF